ncbi:MAG: HD domain-containing protein [Patescibacteria group bacterium]
MPRSPEYNPEAMSAIIDEGKLSQEKIAELTNTGKPIIEGSGLVEIDKEIGPEEVERARELFESLLPVDKDNRRLQAHMQLTAMFTRRIAEKLHMNPNELEALAWLHDIGRTITHRLFRNDLLGDLLLKKMGIREDFLKKMRPLADYLGPAATRKVRTIDDISPEERVLQIADFAGKRNAVGEIASFDEMLEYHRQSRKRYEDVTGLKQVWPSELYASRHMMPGEDDPGIIEGGAKIYEGIRDWLKEQGVDIEELRQEFIKEEVNEKL